MKAFVFRSGLVRMDTVVPDSALEVGDGPQEILEPIVGVVSRHAYNKVDLLCPGVPEAENDTAALDAVIHFQNEIKRRLVRALSDPEYAASLVEAN